MSPSTTSGADARTDLATDLNADLLTAKTLARPKNKPTNKQHYASFAVHFLNIMRKDIEQNLIENDDIELTKEELDIAKKAAGLSVSDGLSSGEDHVAHIKFILSVG